MTATDVSPAHLEVRLTLLSPAQGGRTRGVASGYMPNVWLPGASEPMLASASIELIDAGELEPGETAAARVFPFFPELWQGIQVGAELAMTEGPERQVGRAVVTRVVMPAMSTA